MGRIAKSRLERRTVKGYHELAPARLLSPFVDRFWHAAAAENSAFQHYAIVPDGCVDVVYEELNHRVRCLVFGTTSRMQLFRIAPDAKYFGVRFRPGMARYFLDLRPSELIDRHLDVPAFLGFRPEQVAEAPTLPAKSAMLGQALMKILHRDDVKLSPLDRAIHHVQQNLGVGRVEILADMCGLSSRQVERTVFGAVGLSPKLLLRILRIQAAITAIHEAPQGSLADLAAALGYSDQAHMNRDFRLLTGRTPSQYRMALARERRSDSDN